MGTNLFRTPESRKCEEICETQQSSQHSESLLGRECPGKVKLKTEVSGSWVCLELPEFPGFSLLLKPIPGRDSQHCTPLGTALPSCATAQPGGALSHRPGHALGWGSSRSPPAARVCRAGWKGWSAQRKGSGRSVQEVSSKPRGEAAWAEMLQMCRALPLCPGHTPPRPYSDPDVLGSSCPHQQQPKKSPNWLPLQPPQDAGGTRL